MGSVVADPDVIDLLKEIKAHRDIEKAAKIRKENAMQRLYNIVGEHDQIATDDGEVLATWKYSKDSISFDRTAFMAVYPDLYKDFEEVKPGVRKLDIKIEVEYE